MPHKFRAYVAGFGSGKTWAGTSGIMRHAWEMPGVNAGYFAPTYPHIRDIFYPTVEEVAFDWGLRTTVHESNKEVTIYEGNKYRTTVICRSMERPEKIVGFKIGHALIDELDVMVEKKAEQAFRKIIARMRYLMDGLKNGVDVTTTPEGFRFTYAQFVRQLAAKPELRARFGMIQASTYQNAKNLPADYIPSLLDSYPAQLIDAYLRGKFVNLTSGAVYPDFCRFKNHSNETIQHGEELHIGMDFNVRNMSAVVFVVRDGQPLALEEFVGQRDTTSMAEAIRVKYEHGRHEITIYPDASGQNTSTNNSTQSDHDILRKAGFSVMVNLANPAVRDRLNAVNTAILNNNGRRLFKVNTHACPKLTESLEQQVFTAGGEPDKSAGKDHCNDAAGYFIVRKFPVLFRHETKRIIHHAGDTYGGY
ncbi:terminase [Deefgea sp. CFH1-16]|nr:terminase [Deefgea sp. CFH1-16]